MVGLVSAIQEISSVPARKHVVTGAQPPDLWERVLDELAGVASPA